MVLEGVGRTQRLKSRQQREFAGVVGLLEAFEEQAPEQLREHTYGEKEPRPASDPASSIRGKSTAGHHAVQMRVMHQRLAPGMEYGEETNLATEVLGIGTDGAQRLRDGGEEHVVEQRAIVKGNGGDRLWQSEHDMKVLTLEQFGLALFDPRRTRQGLAFWTMPVATTIERDALMLAVIALFDVTAQSRATAHLDGVQHATVGAGH